jgi:hypothetical protein
MGRGSYECAQFSRKLQHSSSWRRYDWGEEGVFAYVLSFMRPGGRQRCYLYLLYLRYLCFFTFTAVILPRLIHRSEIAPVYKSDYGMIGGGVQHKFIRVRACITGG